MPLPRLTSATADADVHVLAAGAVSSRHRSGALDLARVGSGLPARVALGYRGQQERPRIPVRHRPDTGPAAELY